LSREEERLEKIRALVEAVADRKGEDVVALDVRQVTSFADTFVLATGSSDRNVRAIADAVVEAAQALGEKPLGVEGYEEGRWVLVDLGDAIVHVFLPDVREHYALERLYADAPPVELAPSPARGTAR
jgi:ribosome-associated protein